MRNFKFSQVPGFVTDNGTCFQITDQIYTDWVDSGGVTIPADIPLVVIPQSVTRFQARAALHLAGLLQSVDAMMSDPSADMLAKLAWQDAQEFKRTSPTVLAMAKALNLTDKQVDDLFVQAAGIEA